MSARGFNKKIISLESLKWIGVIFLIFLSFLEGYFLRDFNLYIKIGLIFISIVLTIYITLNTKLGKLLVLFSRESFIELQKVIWPSYQDSLNTTLIIIIVTMIMSVMLWGLDAILVKSISFGLRL